jgi:hypothetical protein
VRAHGEQSQILKELGQLIGDCALY